eukprot:631012-Pleurochrysis_carterae.AAC.1
MGRERGGRTPPPPPPRRSLPRHVASRPSLGTPQGQPISARRGAALQISLTLYASHHSAAQHVQRCAAR